MDASDKIFYLYAMPEWEKDEITRFQGFYSGLLKFIHLFPLPLPLPTSVTELGYSVEERVARRREGVASFAASIVDLESLLESDGPPLYAPFMVVFTPRIGVAEELVTWAKKTAIPPLIVSLVPLPGVIQFSALTLEYLKQYCKRACQQAINRGAEFTYPYFSEIEKWRADGVNTVGEVLGIRPSRINELVLASIGKSYAEKAGFDYSKLTDLEDAMSDSTRAIFQIQIESDDQGFYLLRPEHPDLILFAPAFYRGVFDEIKQQKPSLEILRGLKLLERRDGYNFDYHDLSKDTDDFGVIANMFFLRQNELHIQSQAVSMRAASTFAATIIIPNKVNRVQGTVEVFTRHIRRYKNEIPPDKKTARVFKSVQNALIESIPKDHLNLIAESRTGIKIIGNAPLEWIPVDGIPIGISSDVSRINATPGDLLLEQLKAVPMRAVNVSQFKEYLLVSMYEKDEASGYLMSDALSRLAKEKGLKGLHLRPESTQEFRKALRAYKGAIVIVDCHGGHPEKSTEGGLFIGGKLEGIRDLLRDIEIPPIVVLSACETHPFDRSHVTVANQFLRMGAINVISTVLPIYFKNAAVFLLRLMLRAVQYGSDINSRGVSVPWSNIVGGAFRQHLAFEIAMGLITRRLLPPMTALRLQQEAVIDLNFPPRRDWLHRLGERVKEAGKINDEIWQSTLEDIIATSDTIRYVSMGNPESIVLLDETAIDRIKKGH